VPRQLIFALVCSQKKNKTMESIICVGIDPGLKGGVAIFNGDRLTVFPMPLLNSNIDAYQLHATLSYCGKIHFLAIEEAASRPDQGVISMFSFGKGYGALLAIIEILKIPYIIVKPQTWKAGILPNTKKDKAAAIAYCQTKYPNVSITRKHARTPSDGMADSICIARYACKYFEKLNQLQCDSQNSEITKKTKNQTSTPE
jgi:hypothetical protein